MTPEQLIQCIKAEPEDDLVRLAYADALEEQGDPMRALFVRTQVTCCLMTEREAESLWRDAKVLKGHTGYPWLAGCRRLYDLRMSQGMWWWEWQRDSFLVGVTEREDEDVELDFRRGFSVAVSCTIRQWMEYGRDVAAANPLLSKVKVFGRWSGIHEHSPHGPYGWRRKSGALELVCDLPPAIWDALTAGDPDPDGIQREYRWHESSEAADIDLSAACLRFART